MDLDVTDSGLIDISHYSMSQLLTEADESSLGRALSRIVQSDKDDAYSSFQASI